MQVQETHVQTERILTVPNVLSGLRLLGVPLFLWLVLGPEADGWAVVLLMVSGFTDYFDGYLARRWNQISRVGQLLDPIADRLYVFATLFGLGIRDIVPWWLVVFLLLRDVVLAGDRADPAAARASPRCPCTSSARPRRPTCCSLPAAAPR